MRVAELPARLQMREVDPNKIVFVASQIDRLLLAGIL